jgi:SAM-dependent methyltransferase
MSVFKNYADFYDSIYEDKDYRAECEFIEQVLQRYAAEKPATILDIGCGTGSHSMLLADMGYEVTGVDFSGDMLKIARAKAADGQKRISFFQQDIARLRLPRKFDAAVAMFNVIGYQTTNEAIENTLKSIHRHLRPGGLFIFDVWFGPAVLNERPAERVKNLEHAGGTVIRYARPVLDILNQTVKVSYTLAEVKGNKETKKVEESHLVRFFFYQELLYFMENNGFSVLRICPFMDLGGEVDEHCWNISVIGKGV